MTSVSAPGSRSSSADLRSSRSSSADKQEVSLLRGGRVRRKAASPVPTEEKSTGELNQFVFNPKFVLFQVFNLEIINRFKTVCKNNAVAQLNRTGVLGNPPPLTPRFRMKNACSKSKRKVSVFIATPNVLYQHMRMNIQNIVLRCLQGNPNQSQKMERIH